MEYTLEQKLERAFTWVMRTPEYVSYSGILMIGESTITDEPNITAYTDGFNVRYGREFMDKLTEPEIRFVVLHENLHKMFRHLVVWRRLWEQDAMLANMACDYVINLIIMESNTKNELALPKGGLLDQKYKNMDSHQVFALLQKECEQNENGLPDGMQGDGDGEGFDQHGWAEAKEFSQQELKEISEQIDSAIRQGSILAGKIGGNVSREIGELLKVKTDYRVLLQDFLQANCKGSDLTSWRRPNRRWLQYDIYMPSGITEAIDHAVVAIDTSGSIQGAILTNFISNVVRMLEQVNPARVDLLYWDSKVAGHETYFTDNLTDLATSTKPKGGGGTSPSCITEYMEKNKIQPTCAVVLTDGYVGSDWGGSWNCPVIWCVADNPSAVPATGVVAHI